MRQLDVGHSISVDYAVVQVESMTKCKDCTYDERGILIHTCGPCEEEAIKARIQWWQDGKKKLKEKEK